MLLSGKRGLITGIVNDKSIAWSVAKLASQHGAQIAISYQNSSLAKRVLPLAEEIGCKHLYECDFSDSKSVEQLSNSLESQFGKLDFILHAIAFVNKEALKGRYLDTKEEDFEVALKVSCYSLATLLRSTENIMNAGCSVVTLTYYGSSKVVPSYNVMGVAKAALEASVRYLAFDLGSKEVRVNAVSAGPVKTLASSAIRGFGSMMAKSASASPLRRNIVAEDVAGASIYLFSPLSSGVTGEVHYVDAGYNIMGYFPFEDS